MNIQTNPNGKVVVHHHMHHIFKRQIHPTVQLQ
jgi:hypothetical protein